MPAPIDSGTMNLSVTAAPVTPRPCTQLWIHNNDATINVLVGNSSAQNYTLGPGQAVEIRCGNRNQVWVKSASATPVLSYLSS